MRDGASIATSVVNDSVTGEDVPSALATPEWIVKDTVAKVISDGFATAEDVCAGDVAKACADLNIQ